MYKHVAEARRGKESLGEYNYTHLDNLEEVLEEYSKDQVVEIINQDRKTKASMAFRKRSSVK